MQSERVCIVLSFDSNMFQQARECIASVRLYCKYDFDICVVPLELEEKEMNWLKEQKVIFFDNLKSLPMFKDAPLYAYAQTCRPYLREIFPGYDVYMWIDSDIRIIDSYAFDYYISNALLYQKAIVISQEIDNTYIFVQDPRSAADYHSAKNERLLEVYGSDIAGILQYFYCFNSGIFAISHESDIWENYKNNLAKTLQTSYNHIKEQEAMNVAIAESGMNVCTAPSTMNWLCASKFPMYDTSSRRWVRPSFPHIPISVLHLTASNSVINLEGKTMTIYEYYKIKGLT